MWLSMALLLTSKRASPTLCCFRESSSSQAAPLPDRVRGRAAVLGWGGGAENCWAPAPLSAQHTSLSALSLLSCTAGSWGVETS